MMTSRAGTKPRRRRSRPPTTRPARPGTAAADSSQRRCTVRVCACGARSCTCPGCQGSSSLMGLATAAAVAACGWTIDQGDTAWLCVHRKGV
eukprot:1467619-Prymnesium_polylepis.2